VIRPAPVADPARRPAFRVVGDSALVGTLRELTGTAPAGVNIVAARLFDPQLLQRHVDADGTVLPVFELDHQLVIGPLLTGTSCPCVRCLYGRLYANTQQPVAFRTLLHAVARVGAAGLIGAEAAAVVDAEERSGLARSVLSCAADNRGAAAGGADRPVFTLDLATGEWRRRDFAPLPGRVNEHAWKER
jgi:bacteriocin biosynthesis cyclodehydratase domain-containing protein